MTTCGNELVSHCLAFSTPSQKRPSTQKFPLLGVLLPLQNGCPHGLRLVSTEQVSVQSRFRGPAEHECLKLAAVKLLPIRGGLFHIALLIYVSNQYVETCCDVACCALTENTDKSDCHSITSSSTIASLDRFVACSRDMKFNTDIAESERSETLVCFSSPAAHFNMQLVEATRHPSSFPRARSDLCYVCLSDPMPFLLFLFVVVKSA